MLCFLVLQKSFLVYRNLDMSPKMRCPFSVPKSVFTEAKMASHFETSLCVATVTTVGCWVQVPGANVGTLSLNSRKFLEALHDHEDKLNRALLFSMVNGFKTPLNHFPKVYMKFQSSTLRECFICLSRECSLTLAYILHFTPLLSYSYILVYM